MTLSPGKQKSLAALSTDRGIIAALAIDQRGALRKLFAKATGRATDEVSADLLANFKSHVSRILTPHASAILLDPELGLPAAGARAPNAGLLLAYEQTGYDKSIPGRLPRLLGGFSAVKLRALGADAVKILLYYSPFSSSSINAQKFAWVDRIGQECSAADIPFFLELVSYHDDMDEKGPEFAAAHFRRASDACSLPFIYLSEGVSNETFADALAIAAEAGSEFSGVLCGRATWQDGVAAFVQHGEAALDAWLNDQGVKNIQNVNAGLAAAHPWNAKRSSLSERAT